MSNVIKTNDIHEVTDIINDETNVIVDFFAPWCGPCKMVAPILDEISTERTDVKIVMVNVDESPDLAKKYNVRAVPTLLFIKDAEVVATNLGSITKGGLMSKIESEF